MWDRIEPLMPFPVYAEKVQGNRAMYDPNPCHTYGRNGVEFACWKLPVVGSDRVLSYNKLFPGLSCDPFDHKKAMEKFKIALTDNSKKDEILDQAYEDVEWFNYHNSMKRWREAFEIANDRGGYEWYSTHG